MSVIARYNRCQSFLCTNTPTFPGLHLLTFFLTYTPIITISYHFLTWVLTFLLRGLLFFRFAYIVTLKKTWKETQNALQMFTRYVKVCGLIQIGQTGREREKKKQSTGVMYYKAPGF